MLKKELSPAVYQDGLKTGSTSVITYSDTFQAEKQASVDLPLRAMLNSYIVSRAGSVMVAWNMSGHDRHVLRRAVGDTLAGITLWDALPWFRSAYGLPKNTMSSNKPGTPRSLFNVPVHGAAHSSLSDAVHMRNVVQRAAYCMSHDQSDTQGYRSASQEDLFAAACHEIEQSVIVKEWKLASSTAWIPGLVPASVLGT
jgi:hypothetical protein